MTFSIIKRKRNPLGLIPNFIWAFLLLGLLVMITFRFLKNSFFDIYMIIIVFTCLGIIIYRFADIEKLNSNIIGKITFQENTIIISDKIVELKDLRYLHLKLKNYRYELQDISESNFFIPMYFSGKNNYFKIITTDNKEFNGEFLILSRYDFLKLKMWNEDLNYLRVQQSIT